MRFPTTKKSLLDRAQGHIFSTGLSDAASHMCLTNMRYGLSKIHYVQEKFGFRPDATFATTPDETVSRNAVRWEQGISYGGKVSWGAGKDKFMILDLKPNCCGMLVGGISSLPDPKKILKRVAQLQEKSCFINDVKVEWDFYKGNHFIDVFRVESHDKSVKIPRYAAILHAGCPELKGETDHGSGLYWNMSKSLMDVAKKTKTPFGPMYTLDGSAAADYYKFYQFADDFAKKRRELAFKYLFGGKMICNHTHQGLINPNEILLGCQHFTDRGLYPVSIRADLPSYLVRGRSSFTPHQMDLLGFSVRAHDYGVTDRLSKSNILPHGGGYNFQDSLSVDKVFEIGGKRYFQIDMADGMGKKILSNMKEIQFTYRGREVVQRTLDLGMCDIAAQLNPVYTIKI